MSTFGLIPQLFSKSFLDWSTLPPRGKEVPTRLFLRHDYQHPTWGGPGVITGLVSIGATQVKRKVRLYESKSGVLVRESWSDVNGVYVFTGLRLGLKYTVTATDYENNYNDVVAANLNPV